MGLNQPIAYSKSLYSYIYSQTKCYSFPGLSEKVRITAKFQKTEFYEHATSGVSVFSITFIYLIQFIMGQNYHNSC